jgi:hypothetical protein
VDGTQPRLKRRAENDGHHRACPFTGTKAGSFDHLPGPLTFLRTPTFVLPIWVVTLCALTMAIGTAAGGWRIIRTRTSDGKIETRKRLCRRDNCCGDYSSCQLLRDSSLNDEGYNSFNHGGRRA